MMRAILCGATALAYHRTPPVLLDAKIPLEVAAAPPPTGAGFDASLARCRANERQVARAVKERLLGELKGARLPVEVMCDKGNRSVSGILQVRRIPPTLKLDEDAIDLGGGLYVASPVATLAHLARDLGVVALAKVICEFAGLYTLQPDTALLRLALCTLLDEVDLRAAQRAYPDHLYAYCDESGNARSFLDRNGDEIPWELSFDRNGRPSGIWRRAPLISLEDLQVYAAKHKGEHGVPKMIAAAKLAHAGLASPLETQAALLLHAPRRMGGEGDFWPPVLMNAAIAYSEGARAVSDARQAVADQLIPAVKGIIEVNGEGFHADDQGFAILSGRTAALEHMGYRVFDFNSDQLADLEKFQLRVESVARELAIPLPRRTASFLKRQKAFHEAVFARDGLS